jgi:hypothetical protein
MRSREPQSVADFCKEQARRILKDVSGGACGRLARTFGEIVAAPLPDRLVALVSQLDGPFGEEMHETDIDREARLRELASKLFFTLTKEGSRFSLYREADVSQPVRHDGLSLDEVEETLHTWKLRGFHGG